MINSSPNLKSRTQLFFNQWEYCGQFYLPEANVLRDLDHAEIDRKLTIRKHWNRKINFGGSWSTRYRAMEITPQVVENVHGICDFLTMDQTEKKLVLHTNHLYLYANDAGLFDRIARTGLAQLVSVTQAVVTGQPNTVMLKQPKHQYRTYFRELSLEQHTADSLRQFLNNQQNLRLSPSLKWWVNDRWRRVLGYYFLDHDDQSLVTMLGMIDPRIIRKTLPITAAK